MCLIRRKWYNKSENYRVRLYIIIMLISGSPLPPSLCWCTSPHFNTCHVLLESWHFHSWHFLQLHLGINGRILTPMGPFIIISLMKLLSISTIFHQLWGNTLQNPVAETDNLFIDWFILVCQDSPLKFAKVEQCFLRWRQGWPDFSKLLQISGPGVSWYIGETFVILTCSVIYPLPLSCLNLAKKSDKLQQFDWMSSCSEAKWWKEKTQAKTGVLPCLLAPLPLLLSLLPHPTPNTQPCWAWVPCHNWKMPTGSLPTGHHLAMWSRWSLHCTKEGSHREYTYLRYLYITRTCRSNPPRCSC